MLKNLRLDPFFEGDDGNGEGGEGGTQPAARTPEELEKKVNDLNAAVSAERHEKQQLKQQLQGLMGKAGEYDRLTQVWAEFGQNQSIEAAEKLLGVKPGTLSAGTTKKERQTENVDEMPDEMKPFMQKLQEEAEARTRLENELRELKESGKKQTNDQRLYQYRLEFNRVLDKHFPEKDYTPEQRVRLAKELHMNVGIQGMEWEKAVEDVKGGLKLWGAKSKTESEEEKKKREKEELKKVAENNKKKQPGGGPSGAEEKEKKHGYHKRDRDLARKEARMKLNELLQERMEKATTG